jgi:hypothetical protein
MKLLSFLSFLLFSTLAFAQLDTIVQKNGLRSAVRIVEMNAGGVRFKIPGEADTNKVNALKHYSIDYLVLANGRRVKLNELPKENSVKNYETSLPPQQNELTGFANHYVGLEMSTIIFNTISLNYRYLFPNGALAIRIPVSYNLSPKAMNSGFNELNSLYRKYSVGLEVSFFPFLQKRLSYYIGPELRYGVFDYQVYSLNCITYPCPYETRSNGTHLSFVINQGALFHVSKNMWSDFAVGLGIQKNDKQEYGEVIGVRGSMQFSIGYSF